MNSVRVIAGLTAFMIIALSQTVSSESSESPSVQVPATVTSSAAPTVSQVPVISSAVPTVSQVPMISSAGPTISQVPVTGTFPSSGSSPVTQPSIVTTAPVTSASKPTSGKCGDNLIWKIDENGTVTISGTGDMYNYEFDMSILVKLDKTPFDSSVKKVIVENGVTGIGSGAFRKCKSLTSVKLPDSVKYIEKSAFSGCENLESINIPNGIIKFNKSVFSGCKNLKSIDIPGTVTCIDDSAFSECISLKSVKIPLSTVMIGDNAFFGCSGLTSVTIPENVEIIGYSCFSGCTGLTSMEIPDGVSKINNKAFFGCTSLTTVKIPDSVTYIGDSAFSGCTALKTLNIPAGVTEIGEYAFKDTKWLEYQQELQKNHLVTVNGLLIDGSKASGAVKIQEGTEIIKKGAFRNCKDITSVDIPESVKIIEQEAFNECSNLTDIKNSSGVKSVGEDAFSGTAWLKNEQDSFSSDLYGFVTLNNIIIKCVYDNRETEIVIPDGIKTIGEGSFAGLDIKSVKIPSSVTAIEKRAFYRSAIESVEIPGSVKTIGKEAFRECNYLKTALINKGTETIGGDAFFMSGLEEVVLPEGLKNIGIEAFACSRLKTVSVPSSVSYIGGLAFGDTQWIKQKRDERADHLVIVNGTLIDAEGIEGEDLTVPEGVTTLAMGVGFKNSLKSLTLPQSLISIENKTFNNCYNLESLSISAGIKSIAEDALNGCTNLKNVTILNPDCEFTYGDYGQIAFYLDFGFSGTVRGIKNSSAEMYALRNGYRFEAVDVPAVTDPVVTTVPAVTTEVSEQKEDCGDTDGDGLVTVTDMIKLIKYILNSDNDIIISNADMNADGKVNVMDLRALKKILLKK